LRNETSISGCRAVVSAAAATNSSRELMLCRKTVETARLRDNRGCMSSPATFHDELLPVTANRLFIFDMDGTLLLKTTASIEIAKVTGTIDQLYVLEKSFADGLIDAFRFAQEISGCWGILDKNLVRRAFQTTPKLENIAEVTTLIRRGGGKSCLITMSPDFYAEHFYDYGFDFIEASRFPTCIEEQVRPEMILSPKDKAVIAQRLCRQLAVEVKDCVAFGDSMSDYILFKELEHTVSVNGDSRIRTLARYRYDGIDLYEAFLSVCRELL
jgi:phosphoserine phosphatase